MQRIIEFLLKYKYFLFFIFLQIIAFTFTFQSHSFHKSKFINSANAISGRFYEKTNSFQEYLNLKTHNDQLLEENVKLKNQLSIFHVENANWLKDSARFDQKFSYISGKVIKNSYDRKFNHLTIDRGIKDSIEADQAVVNSKGIIGITYTVNDKYATVMSILNGKIKINIKLKNSLHSGTLSWNANDYNVVQVEDLPIQANIKVGDTIVTGGESHIFPADLPVGVIQNFKAANNEYTIVNVLLHNDMSAIGPINIIRNTDKAKLLDLQKPVY